MIVSAFLLAEIEVVKDVMAEVVLTEKQKRLVEGTGGGCSEANIMEKQIGANDRIKAAGQLAKRYGLDKFEDNVDGNGGGVTIIDDTDQA